MAFNVKLPELPYEFNELEPVISSQTVELHYNRHHRAYTDKFNAAAQEEQIEADSIYEVFSKVSKYSKAIRNQGGGWWNHCFYWEQLTTPETSKISQELQKKIEENFETFENFKEQIVNSAAGLFGSGWTWVGVKPTGELIIHNTPNQDNVYMDCVDEDYTPILGIDVWEHAFYLDYLNNKAEHVKEFFKIINWDVVEKRLNEANK